MRRNLLASLMLAQGVPLLLAGDEVGNSQNGNNNAYCQDNPIGWVDWSGARPRGRGHDRAAWRSSPNCAGAFPSCAPRRWVEGRRADGSFGVLWLTPHATEMTEQDWNFPEGRFLSYVLGPVEQDGRAALHRAQRRAADDRVHASQRSRNTAAGRCCSDTASEPRLGAEFPSGAQAQAMAAVGSGVFGRGMTASARFGARVASRRRHLPPLGSGSQARRAHARSRPSDAGTVREGWYEATIPGLGAGTLYKYRIDGETRGPRSGLAFPAAGCVRAERGHRSRCASTGERKRLARPTVAGSGHPGAPRRHVHARRHVSRRDRASSITSSIPASPRSS